VTVTWPRQMYDGPNFSISSFKVHRYVLCVPFIQILIVSRSSCVTSANSTSLTCASSSVFKCPILILIRPLDLLCISGAGGLVGQGLTKVPNTKICYGVLSTGFLLTEGNIQISVMRSENSFADNYKLSHRCRMA
jgi:hypothetical protein